MRIAVSTETNAGLDAAVSPHFGRCPFYALVDLQEGQKQVGAGLEFEPDPERMLAKALAHIDAKRAALKLAPYNPSRFGASGDRGMEQIMELPFEERIAALYENGRI
jgi:hypothetical protein